MSVYYDCVVSSPMLIETFAGQSVAVTNYDAGIKRRHKDNVTGRQRFAVSTILSFHQSFSSCMIHFCGDK